MPSANLKRQPLRFSVIRFQPSVFGQPLSSSVFRFSLSAFRQSLCSSSLSFPSSAFRYHPNTSAFRQFLKALTFNLPRSEFPWSAFRIPELPWSVTLTNAELGQHLSISVRNQWLTITMFLMSIYAFRLSAVGVSLKTFVYLLFTLFCFCLLCKFALFENINETNNYFELCFDGI